MDSGHLVRRVTVHGGTAVGEGGSSTGPPSDTGHLVRRVTVHGGTAVGEGGSLAADHRTAALDAVQGALLAGHDVGADAGDEGTVGLSPRLTGPEPLFQA